jgi:hypothetical protein
MKILRTKKFRINLKRMNSSLTEEELNQIEALAVSAHELNTERRLSDSNYAYDYILGNFQEAEIVRIASNHPKDVHFLHMARRDVLRLIAEIRRLKK